MQDGRLSERALGKLRLNSVPRLCRVAVRFVAGFQGNISYREVTVDDVRVLNVLQSIPCLFVVTSRALEGTESGQHYSSFSHRVAFIWPNLQCTEMEFIVRK